MLTSRRNEKLRFTRDGKYFVGLTLGIGFAAINTGNNLLYLMMGMMLAFIIGSGVLSQLSLRSLQVARRIPTRLYARHPFLVGITVRNAKQRVPSYSIEVLDSPTEISHQKPCYLLKIPPQVTQHVSYRHRFERRGRHQLTGFQIGTRFPFTLFHKSRLVACPSEIIVLPEVHPVTPPQIKKGHNSEHNQGNIDRLGDFYALREYVEGDDPRDIYWRKSAKAGRLLIRQNEARSDRRVLLYLDNRQSQPSPAETELMRQEYGVSQAASLATHYIDRGYCVGLVTRTVGIREGSGQAHLTVILRALALLEFKQTNSPYVEQATHQTERVYIDGSGAVTAGATSQAATQTSPQIETQATTQATTQTTTQATTQTTTQATTQTSSQGRTTT